MAEKAQYWAHTPNGLGEWHNLSSHLEAVAELSCRFASKFGAAEWARIAGLWHDLGKYRRDFQEMLAAVNSGKPKHHVDHSTVGAIHALNLVGKALETSRATRLVDFLQLLVTATVAGHHAGLPDGPAELQQRLTEKKQLYEEVIAQKPPAHIISPLKKLPPLPSVLSGADDSERRLRAEFLVRMIFSALVDADRLDSASFMDEGLPEEQRQSTLRSVYASIPELRKGVDAYIDRKVIAASSRIKGEVEDRVFDYRQAVLQACREAAASRPGAFALNVATGGGKTLSSLSFALRHAERHAKDRVIVVIPFTSIIEQTAAEYRRALGDLSINVIEHHSATDQGFEQKDESGRQDSEGLRQRLAVENWDCPLIVTTAVQFFESLFSSSPSRCRKVHNIANSVIVIDEAQTLPPQLLNPTVWVINELVERYGATIVLSTATQPALDRPFPEVRNIAPMIRDAVKEPPRRVTASVLGQSSIAWPELAARMAEHRQVLCITHQRRDARELTLELDRRLPEKTTLHLSASMCAAHRSITIARIRARLERGQPCRVVSTQLVEAGVDLDFPVVYRSLAGIDSLVQAAGRANREGRLGEGGGLLFVYRADTNPPPGLLRIAADAADGLLKSRLMDGQPLDLFAPEAGQEFFRLYYERVDDKDGGITPMRREFRFRDVDAAFRFIREITTTVVIGCDRKSRIAIESIRRFGPSKRSLRAIQRYTVSVFPNNLQVLLQAGAIEPLFSIDDESIASIYLLREERKDLYDFRFGLDLSKAGESNPEAYII